MPRFSSRTANLHASPIREILSVIERPGMISFAGGLPAPESFPALDPGVLPAAVLQYGPSEGEPALRQAVARDLRALGLDCATDQVLILSGSQQGIDLAAKLFIDPGTSVAVESPTYLAALQAFRFFGARFAAFDPARPRSLLSLTEKPAFAYAIPTFQNPTGRCYTPGQRQALAEVLDAAGIPLFEDDPYRELAYEPCERRPVCALLKRSSWIYQGSFSKTFAPGLRLGYLACSPDLLPLLTRLKQAADLHSNRPAQWLVLRLLEDPRRAARMTEVVNLYREKRDRFAALLEQHLRGQAWWDVPQGGLFFWLRLQRKLDTSRLLASAIEQGVAFMPGAPFHPHAEGACTHLRLNFSHASSEQADKGLAVLSALLAEGKKAEAPPVPVTPPQRESGSAER